MHYNVIIIGGGPGGIFSAYELTKDRSDLRVAVFEAGHSLEKRTVGSGVVEILDANAESISKKAGDRKSVV